MGAWGTGPFENDDAADFAGDLDEAEPAERHQLLISTMREAVDWNGYLGADVACRVIAAVAVVASMMPNGPPIDANYGPASDSVRHLALGPEMAELAHRALLRVTGENSEWKDLWDVSEERSSTSEVVALLQAAVTK